MGSFCEAPLHFAVCIDQTQNLSGVAFQNDPGRFARAVKGKADIPEISLTDPLREKPGQGFPVRLRNIQDHAGFRLLFK